MLWQGMSGYFAACLSALRQDGVQLYVANSAPDPNAPFSSRDLEAARSDYVWADSPDFDRLTTGLDAFSPDALLISSWHIRPYRRIARMYEGRAVRILCMDNQWHETPKQWVGRLSRRAYLQPYFDVAFVPGERAAYFSRLLGFTDAKTMRGLYCADTSCFNEGNSNHAGRFKNKTFLFVGRLVHDKGVDILIDAYTEYRRRSDDPWRLQVAGTGPLALPNSPGLESLGFVPPRQLPALMSQASALVLPSRFEPWGVVVHEAAAAGLPLICTDAVGAVECFVRDGINGFVVPAARPRELALAMHRLERLAEARGAAASAVSRDLAAVWTPSLWAAYVGEELTSLLTEHRAG